MDTIKFERPGKVVFDTRRLISLWWVAALDDGREDPLWGHHTSPRGISTSPGRGRSGRKKNLDEATRALLKEDERYFLRQSLSTPCLNALKSCGGIFIEDPPGQALHGFSREQRAPGRLRPSGGRPGGQGTARHSLLLHEALYETPSPWTWRGNSSRSHRATLNKVLLAPRGHERHRDGPEAGPHRHGTIQDDFHVGCLPRCLPGRHLHRR